RSFTVDGTGAHIAPNVVDAVGPRCVELELKLVAAHSLHVDGISRFDDRSALNELDAGAFVTRVHEARALGAGQKSRQLCGRRQRAEYFFRRRAAHPITGGTELNTRR